MAFLRMDLFSKSLMRTVPVSVIIPADKFHFPEDEKEEITAYKTLYLLHGVFGSDMDWLTGTGIMRYAEEHDLAVVMPAGENAFYLDQPEAHNLYGEFIGRELVGLTRKIFPLSSEKSDTYIGGLSMGGYGAMRNGLKYCDTFGCILALSGAYITKDIAERKNETPFFLERRDYAERCFGALDKVGRSDKNPEYIIEKIREDGREMPRIYMACGEQDSLLGVNREFAEFARKNGADITFEVGKGNHEWDFWDAYIKRGIEWLQIKNSGLGVGSGNIGI